MLPTGYVPVEVSRASMGPTMLRVDTLVPNWSHCCLPTKSMGCRWKHSSSTGMPVGVVAVIFGQRR